MKKFVVMLGLIFFSQISFAMDGDKSLLIKAKELIKNENFSEAIPLLKLYVKNLDESTSKEAYLELANIYFSLKNKTETLKNIKLAISKAGLTEEEFVYTGVLNAEVSNFVWQYFYENYDNLRKDYLKKNK
ncbi:hypothetical protein [Flavobacterium facile]|uniref:hypothetical protein n=1 Tax=Flavobacterium facile TaxID=2893174 RepID=UPI002E784826|nr:hypothetical protein [Flavobacterium sp. T-12]